MSRLEEITEQLNSHPQVRNARNWYDALPKRDQAVVKGVTGLLVAALIFVLIYAPLIRTNQTLQASLDKHIAVYELIAENAGRFGNVSTTTASSGPILSRVTQSARQSGIKLDRYEQDGKGVRVWLDRVKFDRFIAWAETLGTGHGIFVSQISIDRDADTGWVGVRATLTP